MLQKSTYEISTDYGRILEGLVNGTVEYLNGNPNIKSMVVGMSGGIDSTLTAAVAKTACAHKDLKNRNIKIIGISLPTMANKRGEYERARLSGQAFCHIFTEIDITRYVNQDVKAIKMLASLIPPIVDQTETQIKIRKGNLAARKRMVMLYDVAAANSGLVLSTDNFTEYMTGFWTLHGDVGDFGILQTLWKTEVYGLAAYLRDMQKDESVAKALDLSITAIPTDGLGITSSDFDQICDGMTCETPQEQYYMVDKILIDYLNKGDNCNDPVIKQHVKTKFKRCNPYNIPRAYFTGEKVVVESTDIDEKKAEEIRYTIREGAKAQKKVDAYLRKVTKERDEAFAAMKKIKL